MLRRDHGAIAAPDDGAGLLHEALAPRSSLPPLLLSLAQRPAEPLDWLGASFGLTEPLFRFWHRNGFLPAYLRQTKNELTGEHSTVLLHDLAAARAAGAGGASVGLPHPARGRAQRRARRHRRHESR